MNSWTHCTDRRLCSQFVGCETFVSHMLMSTMALVAFESHADVPRVTHFGVASLFDCEAADYNKNSDDKMLVGVLLNIKHHSSSATWTMHTYGTCCGRDAGNLQSRFCGAQGISNCDRILTFGDVQSPGKCFVLIFQSTGEADEKLIYVKNEGAVGDYFAIVEPDAVVRTLAQDDLAIVETQQPLVPLQRPEAVNQSINSKISSQRTAALNGL